MNKIKGYFKGVGQEARRIRWPNRKQLWTSVGIVCVITVISSLVIYFEDWLSLNVMKGFESAFPSSASSSGSGSESIVAGIRLIINYIGGIIR